MWYIGQLLQNPAGDRVLYAGFDFTKSPCFSCFKLLNGKLVQERWSLTDYKELPGDPIPIGRFAQMFNGGFFGEIDLEKLREHALYRVALETLEVA